MRPCPDNRGSEPQKAARTPGDKSQEVKVLISGGKNATKIGVPPKWNRDSRASQILNAAPLEGKCGMRLCLRAGSEPPGADSGKGVPSQAQAGADSGKGVPS